MAIRFDDGTTRGTAATAGAAARSPRPPTSRNPRLVQCRAVLKGGEKRGFRNANGNERSRGRSASWSWDFLYFKVGGWWRLAVGGGWRLAGGGPWGLSLRGVLSEEKKITLLKYSPGSVDRHRRGHTCSGTRNVLICELMAPSDTSASRAWHAAIPGVPGPKWAYARPHSGGSAPGRPASSRRAAASTDGRPLAANFVGVIFSDWTVTDFLTRLPFCFSRTCARRGRGWSGRGGREGRRRRGGGGGGARRWWRANRHPKMYHRRTEFGVPFSVAGP